ncbi:MAG: hypothetical protein LLF89_03280 [Spirochaetaceae bacterium]|nr:hypothetical protein [Spirochaetaceae bacterium]
MSSTEWQEQKREEVFEGTLKSLENRRRKDPQYTLQSAQSELDHFYIQDGNNWLGRGELGDLVMSATIAAYEHFIFEWRSEANPARPSDISMTDGQAKENPNGH